MPHSLDNASGSGSSPFVFLGELTSGLFHLSSDLSKILCAAEAGPCRLEEILYPRLTSDIDLENLRNSLKALRANEDEMVQYVRLDIEGICVWTIIRARVVTRSLGGNILLSGSFEFFSLRRILCELLEQTDFSPIEIDILKTLAAEPREHGLGFIRLESDVIPKDDLVEISQEVKTALDASVPQILSTYLFDSSTILFSCSRPSLNFDHTIGRVVEDILREHHNETLVKEVLHISRGAQDLAGCARLRIGFWKALAKIFTNGLRPTKFSLTEVVLTAHACFDNFAGFKLLIQPLVHKDTLGYAGGEFLIRFASDQGFGPDRFIALLEQSTVVMPFSRFIFEHAAQLAAIMRPKLPKDFRFHVNLSPKQCEDAEIFAFIDKILSMRKIPYESIVIELTETGERTNQAAISTFANLCRSRGIGIAIDDFGTGFNSLDFVLSIPCDLVKFSREITASCLFNSKRSAFFSHLIAGFKLLGLRICLEGIQDETLFAAAVKLDVDQLQGYYFAEPIEIEVFAQTSGKSALLSDGAQDNTRRPT